jgi:hypothetical protein
MCSYEEKACFSKCAVWEKRKIYADFKFVGVLLKYAP